jgi:hypothetical protein
MTRIKFTQNVQMPFRGSAKGETHPLWLKAPGATESFADPASGTCLYAANEIAGFGDGQAAALIAAGVAVAN